MNLCLPATRAPAAMEGQIQSSCVVLAWHIAGGAGRLMAKLCAIDVRASDWMDRQTSNQ